MSKCHQAVLISIDAGDVFDGGLVMFGILSPRINGEFPINKKTTFIAF
jgi:hypothetical protein